MMGKLLDRDQVMDSFSAVRSFLQEGDLDPTVGGVIACKIMVVKNRYWFADDIDFECKDRIDNEAYLLRSNSFKANNHRTPIWSSYVLFTWDDNTKELSVTVDGLLYIIKHP